ncbi:hypothetical protein [Stenotrophomonas mori]|uniref:Uncharacterized protein n=1 Tax=Stenotrophomonas mori TaxID=2871096 RepID=A0ABT0SGL1_9GAMM|nr:hypothetical protein [Stenotrophomonas mori]MCL7714452.1 hypothetical protein [Stenotrophomonas mori]
MSLLVVSDRHAIASSIPFEIKVGGFYEVEFYPIVFDEYFVDDAGEVGESLDGCGERYSYKVVGRLKEGCVSSGELMFYGEFLAEEFGFLDGNMVSWVIDRVDVRFVKEMEWCK